MRNERKASTFVAVAVDREYVANIAAAYRGQRKKQKKKCLSFLFSFLSPLVMVMGKSRFHTSSLLSSTSAPCNTHGHHPIHFSLGENVIRRIDPVSIYFFDAIINESSSRFFRRIWFLWYLSSSGFD